MGRETRLLLGFLALLAGVFLGVLSMKLLVRRPPPGTGPDVHADIAAVESQDLVDPPALAAPEPTAAGATSRFARNDDVASPPRRDPFVAPATFEAADDAAAMPRVDARATLDPPPPSPPPRFTTGAPPSAPAVASLAGPVMSQPGRPPMIGGAHVAGPGDSWWSLAEQAYGDGRLYRALFAWNRALDPRVSLVQGTPIEIPTLDKLQAAWPALLPAD
ncbi:MAG: hypothetical protein ACKOC8_11885 [Pirellulales bacterium]